MLPLPTFTVLMANATDPDEADTFTVQVRNGDRLRAELEGNKRGLVARDGVSIGFHLSTMWIWAAMVRTGDYAESFDQFKLDCLDFNEIDRHGDPVTPANAETADRPTVDPTPPATPAG